MDNKITHPTVSVLMSVYNEPLDWIQQAINSILTQTFTDFEFIIINDKPDRVELKECLGRNSVNDSRIRIHTNPENIGLPKSLNIGLRLCTGKYIARMDADDISKKNRFQRQVDYMNSNPQIGICGTSAIIIDGNGNTKKRFHVQCEPKDLRNAIYFVTPFIHPTVMIRRELILDNLYDEKCRVAQDWNLWLRLSNMTKYANLKDVLFYYRVHGNQSQKKAGKERSRDSREYSDGIFADYLNLTDNLRDIWIRSRNNGPASINELNELYLYLIEYILDKGERKYAVSSYIRKVLKFDRRNIMKCKLIWKHPIIFFQSILFEIRRATFQLSQFAYNRVGGKL